MKLSKTNSKSSSFAGYPKEKPLSGEFIQNQNIVLENEFFTV